MKTDDLVKLARDRMSEAVDADRENRARAQDDTEKLVGQQWPDKIRNEREADGKPCLVFNRLPQFVRQVTGDIRRMNPAIKVSASDNAATEEVAEIYEGLIRHIEQRSDASSVYEQAAESAAACSIGWFRIVTEWERDDSFDQEIRIKRIRNPMAVYADPASEMPTREDAGFAFITEAMAKAEFEKAYPNASMVDAEHDATTDGMEHWHHEGKVVVSEYYWREPLERELLLLQDGSSGFADEAEGIPDEMIVRRRKVDTHKVMWAKITGKEVLEGPTEIPCKYIPVFAVVGEEWHVGEEVYRSSVIRFAKDAQQTYNLMRSAATEVVTMQPKAPFIGTRKQFAGLDDIWSKANSENYAFLPYNPDPDAPGAPQRQAPPMSSQGLTNESLAAADDMKATTGIYDAGLGQRSNEASGVAIRQRQMESDVSTSIYSDNMAKAIAACGRALLSMIPNVYDTYRIVRVLGEDGKEKQVPVNGVQVQDGQEMPVNDLRVGSYDLRVAVGPNYATRRQETSEGMTNFIQAVPAAAPLIGDLVAKAQDWPDADQIAARLEKALPPGIRDMSDLSEEEQAAQQQAMQAQQAEQQMAMQEKQIEMRKAAAEVAEAEADAQKAQFEAEEQRLALMQSTGTLSAIVQQEVQRQVAQIVMGTQPGAPN